MRAVVAAGLLGGVFGAGGAHEVADAPFDRVAVQEQGARGLPGGGFFGDGGIVLDHCDADGDAGGAIFDHRRDGVRDEVPGGFEGAECSREGVFVAPADAALGDEGVVVFGAVEIVVGREAEGLKREGTRKVSRCLGCRSRNVEWME